MKSDWEDSAEITSSELFHVLGIDHENHGLVPLRVVSLSEQHAAVLVGIDPRVRDEDGLAGIHQLLSPKKNICISS